MEWCYIVTIQNLSVPNSQETIARVFTKQECAELFIEDCKKNENPLAICQKWQYKILEAEIDGNPLDGFQTVRAIRYSFT